MTWEIVITLVSLTAAICGIVFGFLSSKRQQKKDIEKDAATSMQMMTELSHIRKTTDGIQEDIKELKIKQEASSKETAINTEKIGMTNEKLKEHDSRIRDLEKACWIAEYKEKTRKKK